MIFSFLSKFVFNCPLKGWRRRNWFVLWLQNAVCIFFKFMLLFLINEAKVFFMSRQKMNVLTEEKSRKDDEESVACLNKLPERDVGPWFFRNVSSVLLPDFKQNFWLQTFRFPSLSCYLAFLSFCFHYEARAKTPCVVYEWSTLVLNWSLASVDMTWSWGSRDQDDNRIRETNRQLFESSGFLASVDRRPPVVTKVTEFVQKSILQHHLRSLGSHLLSRRFKECGIIVFVYRFLPPHLLVLKDPLIRL